MGVAWNEYPSVWASETEIESEDEVGRRSDRLEVRRRVAAFARREIGLWIDAPILGEHAEVPRRERHLHAARTRLGGEPLRQRERRGELAPLHEVALLEEAIE